MDSDRNGHRNAISSEPNRVNENFPTEGDERERFLSVASVHSSMFASDSKAEGREDDELGSVRETTNYRTLEEKLAYLGSHSSGHLESAEGGGSRFADGEEELPPPSTSVCINSVGGTADGNTGGSITDIANTQSPLVDEVSEGDSVQKRRNNLQELAEKVSEPLGMAVATVLYEIFEQNGVFGTGASPVDELSQLLGAALKESLFCVLGTERTIFVENFRNSFKRTYSTIRSVRHAYVKTRGRLTRSRHSHPRSRRGSQFDPKHMKFGNESTTKSAQSHSNYPVESIAEEEITSCTSTRRRQQGELSDAPSTSGKSCLNESLESLFYTDSNREQDGLRDTAGSCTESCLSESSESSFTSGTVEQGERSGIARSSSMNSVNESLPSPLSQATPDARDVKSEHLDTDDSGENHMFSATSSSESNKSVMVDRGGVISEARGQTQSNHMPTSLHPGLLPAHATNFLDSVIVNSPLDRPQVVTSTASNDIRESSCWTSEPSMNIQGAALRQEAELFGRENGGSILIHRRPGQVWGEVNQLTGSALEETVLRGTPVLDFGIAGAREALVQRYVEAMENQNHLMSLKLSHSIKSLSVKEGHLQLQSESNILMRENVDLSRTKIEFREYELEDRKLTAAHHELSQMCADELVAGLVVMLFTFVFGTWKFSYTRLSRVVTICQLPVREPRPTNWFGTSWMSNSVDALGWHLKALTCEVTKAGRMLAGLILIAFVASSLLRRSAMSSSQAMPATIILVVLGGICGFAGKISIDSLGGDGFLWVMLWELLCFLHAFATCCTPWLYKYLYGPSKFYQGRKSFWLKSSSICARVFFHTFLVFALPVMAGLLPFASLKELNKIFWELLEADSVFDPI